MLFSTPHEKLCALDAKGRVRLPSSIINELGEEKAKFFMIRAKRKKGILQVLPMEAWGKRAERLQKIDLMLEENEEYVRKQMLGFSRVERDSSGRIQIPKHVSEKLGFEGQLMVTAFSSLIEIWQPDRYYDYLEDEEYDMEGESRRLFNNSGQNGEK